MGCAGSLRCCDPPGNNMAAVAMRRTAAPSCEDVASVAMGRIVAQPHTGVVPWRVRMSGHIPRHVGETWTNAAGMRTWSWPPRPAGPGFESHAVTVFPYNDVSPHLRRHGPIGRHSGWDMSRRMELNQKRRIGVVRQSASSALRPLERSWPVREGELGLEWRGSRDAGLGQGFLFLRRGRVGREGDHGCRRRGDVAVRMSWWDDVWSKKKPEPPPGWPSSSSWYGTDDEDDFDPDDEWDGGERRRRRARRREGEATQSGGDIGEGIGGGGGGPIGGFGGSSVGSSSGSGLGDPTREGVDSEGDEGFPRWQRRLLAGGMAGNVDAMIDDPERFAAWQRYREAQEAGAIYDETGTGAPDDPGDISGGGRGGQPWDDWADDPSEYDLRSGGWFEAQPEWEKGGMPREAPTLPERGLSRSFKELFVRIFRPQDEVEEELTFEERVFRYTSQASAKFVVLLVTVPWMVSWFTHDIILVPFVHQYVHTTPLAATTLDLRERQKLELIERLKLERQRIRFEADIGKAPPLSEEELAGYLQEEARHLREEIREENQAAFAHIFSDAVGLGSLLLVIALNPKAVSILRLTSQRIFTNISDTGKAFVIILASDIFLGYHSQSGWETVIEMFLDHYGLEAEETAIFLFIAIVPVTMDAFFKLWIFKSLTRMSPSAAATLREMKRH